MYVIVTTSWLKQLHTVPFLNATRFVLNSSDVTVCLQKNRFNYNSHTPRKLEKC